jgi:membrane protein YqaA with SNARE-associated domain
MIEGILAWLEANILLGVFISHLIAYSIIPFPSEAFLIGASLIKNPFLVISIALIGSTIGSITNYYIGLKGLRKAYDKRKKWERKAEEIIDKYGAFGLVLFGNVPLLADPLIIVAGSFKMNFWKFLIYSTMGKILYFAIIVSIGKGFGALF